MTGYTLFDTRIGRCAIAWTDRGVAMLQLPEATDEAARARVHARFEDAEEAAPPAEVARAMEELRAHLAGEPRDFAWIRLDLSGVPEFHQRVYEAARAIPSGRTRTYGEIAKELGEPGASRAVGQALGKNPVAVIVPCHRVLAAGAKPGGFSAFGGTRTKAKILAAEGLTLDAAPLFDGASAKLPFDAVVACDHVASKDKRLARVMEKVGPLRLRLEETQGVFEALAESIVYQQLTGKAAATIFGRVKALFPKSRLSPERLARIADEDLRGAGLSGAKLAALRDLATKTMDGTVPTLAEIAKMEDDAIVERLTCVRGIGRWTVEMLLIFRLGRPDVLPIHDYGVRKGFARAFGKKELPAPKDLEKFGERWRPFRTVASWYLWRALELP